MLAGIRFSIRRPFGEAGDKRGVRPSEAREWVRERAGRLRGWIVRERTTSCWLFCLLQLLTLFFAVDAAAEQSHAVASFEPEKVVVAISKLKIGVPVRIELGTGFCLSADCDIVATNYHVAMVTGLPLKIKGEQVVDRYLASSPKDDGAIWNEMLDPSTGGSMKYAPIRDLAIFRLKHPLASKGMRGIGFYPYQLQEGQEVDIYTFPIGEKLTGARRKLTRFPGKFVREARDGTLGFRFELSQKGQPIRPGGSGGLVVDRRTQQVAGILRGLASNGDNMAVAVPIWSLANFIRDVQADIYAKLFPIEVYRPYYALENADEIVDPPFSDTDPRPVVADSYLKFGLNSEILPLPRSLAVTLQRRDEESPEIQHLRVQAQSLAYDIKNFVALQTLSYGGGGTSVTHSQYEIRVTNGRQEFRKYPNGKTGLSQLPLPKSSPALAIGAEWSTLPDLVGTNLKLKIQQDEDTFVDGRRVKVFRYQGDLEDRACEFRSSTDFIFFQRDWVGAVLCNGEVWADENMNILRISESYDLPPSKTKWRHLRAVVMYGWLEKSEEAPRLVPASIFMQAEFEKKIYWCQGQFTNYRMFSVKTKVLGPVSNLGAEF